LFVSCATSSLHTGKENTYKAEVERKKLKVILKSEFDTLLGMKFANISLNDVSKSNHKECSYINPGEANDPWLFSVHSGKL